MSKTELKTQPTDQSVDDYLNKISDDGQRSDCKAINDMMKKATGQQGVMWGSSIVGFGTYRYVYASGREGNWMRVGFSPRKGKITIYISDGFDKYAQLLSKLGKHTTSKSCLYIKHMDDIDSNVLFELVETSYKTGHPMGAV